MVEFNKQLEDSKIMSIHDKGLKTPIEGQFNPPLTSKLGNEPLEVELDMEEPKDYNYEERMKKENINPSVFLPIPTHQYIIKQFFQIYSRFYNGLKSIQYPQAIALSITFLFMLGSNFLIELLGFLFEFNDTDSLFFASQMSSSIFFPRRVGDEDYHLYPERLDIRNILEKSDSRILEIIKGKNIQLLYETLAYKDKQEFERELKEFISEFSTGNPLSEDLESFITNGVVTGRQGTSTSNYILFKHNFKANRSTSIGNPINKLFQEISNPEEIMGNETNFIKKIESALRLEKFNRLLNTIFNLFIIWNYIKPELKELIYSRVPDTKSYVEEKKEKGDYKAIRWNKGESSSSIISVKLEIPQFLLQHIYSLLNAQNKKNLETELLELIKVNEIKESNEPEEYEDIPKDKGFYKKIDSTYEINELVKEYTGKSLLELISEIKDTYKKKKRAPNKKLKPKSKIEKKKKTKKKKSGSRKNTKKKKSRSRKNTKKKKRKIEIGDIVIKYN